MPDFEILSTIGFLALLVGGVAAVLAWSLLAYVSWRWLRIDPIEPGPAIQEPPGDEPPAVVSLIAQGWVITSDAAESTLIDLAARRLVEFRQPGPDPRQTTVHVLDRPTEGLLPHERLVLDRVRACAWGGSAPIEALRGRGPSDSAWHDRFAEEVLGEARARGLSRPASWLGPALWPLHGAAWLAGFILGLPWMPPSVSFWYGMGAAIASSIGASRLLPKERDTPLGREVAARWLGLRSFMAADQSFAAQPPAAVMLWDRLLAYGDALGVTHLISELVDFGEGDRRRVWSGYGGTWRRVRVRYPRFGRPGLPAGSVVSRAVLVGGVAALMFWLSLRTMLRELGIEWPGVTAPARGSVWDEVLSPSKRSDPDDLNIGFGLVLMSLLGLVIARSLWRVWRTVVDLIGPVEVEGEVLWRSVWRSMTDSEDDQVPLSYHLPVDDGRSQETTAWALSAELARQIDPQPHDIVRLRGRPWSRWITRIEIVQRRGFAPEEHVG